MSRIHQFKDIGSSSYASRIDFKYAALKIVKDHPLIGTGTGGLERPLSPVPRFSLLDHRGPRPLLPGVGGSRHTGLRCFFAMWGCWLITCGGSTGHARLASGS